MSTDLYEGAAGHEWHDLVAELCGVEFGLARHELDRVEVGAVAVAVPFGLGRLVGVAHSDLK